MNTVAIINIAKGQLGLDDTTYRALLQRVTGVASLRIMTERQKIAVLEEMKRQGFKVKVGGKKLPASVKPYVRMIYALWSKCYRLGVIEDASRPALRAFCKRFVAHGINNAVVDPDMLSYQQAEPIIEALKRMEARGKAAQEGSDADAT